jgi:hypothetical protein
MSTPIALAKGNHLLIENVVNWKVSSDREAYSPKVILTASIQSDPNQPIYPDRTTATTLATQMDAQVAIELYEKLGELGRKMGWLPQREGEPQA